MICEPRDDKLNPANPYIAKFSLPYLVAARIVEGRPTSHETFKGGNITRPDILSLAGRVTHRLALPGETRFPQTFPGKLTATLRDGTCVDERLDVNLGHPENPLSFEEIVSKFTSNSSEVLGPGRVDQVVNLVASIDATDAGALAESLRAR
jgi:2-methylcitrate dehydratase PrpD